MRIIAGNSKGRTIKVPKNLPVRPTTDFCKESLFNILENHFNWDDLFTLDLFSGTGAISFEFASRGVKKATAVDANPKCHKHIQQASKNMSFNQLVSIRADAMKFLQKTNHSYHIIFADPPYAFTAYNDLHKLVFDREILKESGWLIIEHDAANDLSELNHFVESRKYGQSKISIFR